MKTVFNLIFLTLSTFAFSQTETVGLLKNDPGTADGFTLFTPDRNENTYLINNCGEVINQWTFSEEPGLTCYLLENGNLLQAGKDSLEIRDWDNNLVWSYHVNGLGVNQHHDIEPLPNGNILLIINDAYTSAEMIALGLDPQFASSNLKLDKIIELEPTVPGMANIVWEWKFYDHLVQDLDPNLPNYGIIADHPELLDMNYEAENESDFTHVNAIDYNETLDQIIISARHTNEIYIIDHSTTTVEASSHSGGNSGKGGDFLWRWGNPFVYGAGTESDQKLGRQHDCKWIESGTHAGAISVFNNEGSDGFNSSVHIITPSPVNGAYPVSNNAFLPEDYTWSWNGESLGEVVSGTIKCGVEILYNDNALIVESTKGKITEVTPAGDVVWVYEVPHGDYMYDQFSSPINNGLFRASRYQANYPSFDNVSLSVNDIIEDQNSNSESCSTVGMDELNHTFNISPNPVQNQFSIQSDQPIQSVEILNTFSQMVLKTTATNNIEISHLPNGIYFVKVFSEDSMTSQKMIKAH